MIENKGHLHPISHIIQKTNDIFRELGFAVAEGPEIETEYYNFDALNIPQHHPARDMWDTFWLKPEQFSTCFAESRRVHNSQFSKGENLLLRTHTSPVQVRHALTHKPPIRIIAPGKTYRHEATDATHEAQFFQLEGLMIEESVSLANLKYVVEYYLEKLFSAKVETRMKPSYFPFVEPGVEIDMKLEGKHVPDNLRGKWIEIMGAGMVHPKVLQAMKINSNKFSGFAFGCGIDRLAMLKYGIPDVRMFYQGDLRLTNQF